MEIKKRINFLVDSSLSDSIRNIPELKGNLSPIIRNLLTEFIKQREIGGKKVTVSVLVGSFKLELDNES